MSQRFTRVAELLPASTDLVEILGPACPDIEVRPGHSKARSSFHRTRAKDGQPESWTARKRCGHGANQDHRSGGGPGRSFGGFGGVAGGLELAGRPASGRGRDVPAGGTPDPPAQAGDGSTREAGGAFQDCGWRAFRPGALGATLMSNRVAGGYRVRRLLWVGGQVGRTSLRDS